DGAYAISMRHHGRLLETVRPEEASIAGPTIVRLLGALYALPPAPGVPNAGHPERPAEEATWRRWLVTALVDDPSGRTHGWRNTLSHDPKVDRLFRACQARVRDLAGGCPERREVLHGGLLHGNVLPACRCLGTRRQ